MKIFIFQERKDLIFLLKLDKMLKLQWHFNIRIMTCTSGMSPVSGKSRFKLAVYFFIVFFSLFDACFSLNDVGAAVDSVTSLLNFRENSRSRKEDGQKLLEIMQQCKYFSRAKMTSPNWQKVQQSLCNAS